jgi:hypothetical protein
VHDLVPPAYLPLHLLGADAGASASVGVGVGADAGVDADAGTPMMIGVLVDLHIGHL